MILKTSFPAVGSNRPTPRRGLPGRYLLLSLLSTWMMLATAGVDSNASAEKTASPTPSPATTPGADGAPKKAPPAKAKSKAPVTQTKDAPQPNIKVGLERGYTEDQAGISGNPGAVNVLTGTGSLGELLGFSPDSGVRLGGLWIGNADIQMSGRLPGSASFNSLGIVDLQLNMRTLANIPGASFAATFLQFDGQDSNGRAGVLTGYNGLTETPPLNRNQLYPS